MRRLVTTVLLTGILLGASPAFAQTKAQGIYIGAALGLGTVKQTIEEVEVIDDATFGLKLIGGFRSKFLAVEFDYRNLGTAKGIVDGVQTRTTGFVASLVAMIPVGPIDLLGRGGVFIHNVNTVLNPGDGEGVLKDTTPVYGFGLAFRLGSLSLRGEAERLDIATQDTTWLYSAGVTVAF